MNKILPIGIGFFFLSIALACSNPKNKSVHFNPVDTITPLLVAPGLISTGYFDRDFSMSADGNTICFTRVAPKNAMSVIMEMNNKNGVWSTPEIISFSGKYRDLEASFHPTKDQLYFASDRPVTGDSIKTDFDLWRVDKLDFNWGEPIWMGPLINTTENEYYPSVSQNNTLYFTASYADSKGFEDIYSAEFKDGNYLTPVSLDSSINSSAYEFNAFISPDDSLLIFSSFGRPDGLGGGDLYYSIKDDTGKWQLAVHLDAPINSKFLDFSPFFRNEVLYFSSERHDMSSGKEHFNTDAYHTMLNNPSNGNSNIYMFNVAGKDLK